MWGAKTQEVRQAKRRKTTPASMGPDASQDAGLKEINKRGCPWDQEEKPIDWNCLQLGVGFTASKCLLTWVCLENLDLRRT